MQNYKFGKMITTLVAAAMLFCCLGCFGISVSAADKTDIVRDDLVVWYDASNNSNGLQDYETTVWKDLTGNGNHMTVKLDETNYWTDNAFHAENNPTYFPDAVVDIVNGDVYLVEKVMEKRHTASKSYCDPITIILMLHEER
jgi:hypothetical protein